MRRPVHTFALIVLAAAGSTPLAAQQRPDRGLIEVGSLSQPVRGGFYGSLGFGAGRESYRYSDENLTSEKLTKPTLTLRLGGTPNEQVRLGGEIFAWGNEVEGGTESFATFLMTGQFYPMRTAGLYLRGGVGFARSGASYDDGESEFETGFGGSIGAGWDLRVAPNVFVAPTIDIYQGTFTKRNNPSITERVVNIGFQIGLQSGGKR